MKSVEVMRAFPTHTEGGEHEFFKKACLLLSLFLTLVLISAAVQRAGPAKSQKLVQSTDPGLRLQFRAMAREPVDSDRMTGREFHDAILERGRIPVELLRAYLSGEELRACSYFPVRAT